MTELTTVGVQLHLIIIPAVFLVFSASAIIFGVAAVRVRERNPYSIADGGAYILGGFAALVGIAWAILAAPYDAKYWGLYSVNGTVASVTNAIQDGGDITYRSYIVEFAGDDRPYRFDDPRIVNLEGEQVEALCSIEFVYLAADRWNCDIRSAGFVD